MHQLFVMLANEVHGFHWLNVRVVVSDSQKPVFMLILSKMCCKMLYIMKQFLHLRIGNFKCSLAYVGLCVALHITHGICLWILCLHSIVLEISC